MTAYQKRLLAAFDALETKRQLEAILILEVQAKNNPKRPTGQLRLVGGVTRA